MDSQKTSQGENGGDVNGPKPVQKVVDRTGNATRTPVKK